MADNTLPIGFTLANIYTEQFAILDSSYKESNQENIKLHSSFSFGVDEEDRSVLASPRFTFDQGDVSFIILEIACSFKIDGESWNKLYNAEEQSITLSKGFAAHLAAISVGVARGVLHAKTEQTPFSKFIIPLINVANNIVEDVVIKKDL